MEDVLQCATQSTTPGEITDMTASIPLKQIQTATTWQRELADSVTDPQQLLQQLGLKTSDFADPVSARRLFAMRVPKPFISKMRPGDPQDPLLLQVLPDAEEFTVTPGFSDDPLAEQSNPQPGLLHKYESRVLIIFRGGCAINCRYCFRRHFPYQDNNINKARLQELLDYVQAHSQVNEVILSGGDPLMASDDHIQWFVEKLQAIEHVTRFRIHTRLPVVIPQRLTEQLADILTGSRLKSVMVLHINHANEIDDALAERLTVLSKKGVTLLNQAVLLNKINDTVEAQVALSEKLFEASVMPYYLHLLDKVAGAAHFEVTEAQAKAIMSGMLARLPGFLVPRLVREIPDRPSKTPIDLEVSGV